MHRPSLFSDVLYHCAHLLSTAIFGKISVLTVFFRISCPRQGHNRTIHSKGGATMSNRNEQNTRNENRNEQSKSNEQNKNSKNNKSEQNCDH